MPHPYTTPTYLARISGADLTGARIVLTLKQGRTVLNFTDEDFDSRTDEDGVALVEVTLSQVQSAKFCENIPIKAQVNVIDSNEYRVASDVVSTQLKQQTDRRVESYDA